MEDRINLKGWMSFLSIAIIAICASGCSSTLGDRSLGPRWSLPAFSQRDTVGDETEFPLASLRERARPKCATG